MARRKTIADAEAAEASRFLAGATEIGPLDPVDAAIAAHRAAWTKLLALSEATKTVKPKCKAMDALKVGRQVYDDQTTALAVTPLDNLAQVATFARYVADLKATGRSEWPCPYAIEIWHLADAMDNVADALERLSASQPAVPAAHIRLAA